MRIRARLSGASLWMGCAALLVSFQTALATVLPIEPGAPTANIVASAISGQDSLTVDFSCDCLAGTSNIVSYEWDFGLGYTNNEPMPTWTFQPGTYNVVLTVVDGNGASATDTQEIVVTSSDGMPPSCSLVGWLSTATAPTDIVWTATATAGTAPLKRMFWIVNESSEEVQPHAQGDTSPYLQTQAAASAGWYSRLWVVEDESGLKCSTSYRVPVLNESGATPPRIVSVPNGGATCAVAYTYSDPNVPVALGTGTRLWSLTQAPKGASVDPETGVITWLPTEADRMGQTLVLRVTTEYGFDEQTVAVHVDCTSNLDFGTPFGCSSSGQEPMAGWLTALLFAVLSPLLRRPWRLSRAAPRR